MPKAPFPAAAEGMPKINRAEVFRKAWREYRFQVRWLEDASFNRDLFARLLRDQWHYAKMDRQAAIQRAAENARLEAAPANVRRAAEIRAELLDQQMGDFVPWARHAELSAELAQLGA